MSEPFMGEVKMISWTYPPKGWAFCNGQLLPINQNQALFSILGTQFGGDGRTTFALPDLRGRTPIYSGQGWTLGQAGGEESHTLTGSEMPLHNHLAMASTTNADSIEVAGNILAASDTPLYHNTADLTTLGPTTINVVGGGQPHQNMQPYLVVNFCVALTGIFPSRN
ncbi:MAG: hypothetical protein QOH61_262 [Chloroflexota bacterium]|nr:hypothetical protein [Chloroflexota bacterium]